METDTYALLLPQGLEQPALKLLQCVGLDKYKPYTILPPAAVPPGHQLGAAGAYTPLLISTSHHDQPAMPAGLLPRAIAECSCLAAVLAVLALGEIDSDADTPAFLLRSGPVPVFDADTIAAAVELLHRHRPELRTQAIRFRVGAVRGGKHKKTITSIGLCAAVAEELTEQTGAAACGNWTVDLRTPNVRVVCLLAQARLMVGLLLPPFDCSEPGGQPIPRCMLRDWLTCRDRPHMVPFVAASLVQLAAIDDGDLILDPCGGIGIISIEAALQRRHARAISVEIDPEACAMAAKHAQQAGVQERVAVKCGDSLKLRELDIHPESVDVVVSDLPFGMHHAKIDVTALLRSLWEVVKIGGRALLVGDRCVSTALVRSVAGKAKVERCGSAPWAIEAKSTFAMSGIEAHLIVLVRLQLANDSCSQRIFGQ